MFVNFRTREISRDTYKLAWRSTLKKKKKLIDNNNNKKKNQLSFIIKVLQLVGKKKQGPL